MAFASMRAPLLGLLLLAPGSAGAQSLTIPAELGSPAPTVRMRAFKALARAAGAPDANGSRISPLVTRAQSQDDLASALIALLEREVAFMAVATPDILAGDYGDAYLGDLSITVARLREPRALPSLMHFIHMSESVATEVVALGEPAIQPLLATLDSPHRLRQPAAARALGRIMERRSELGVTDRSATEVRIGLLRAVRDPDHFILRENAAIALGSFNEPDVRAEMERLATSDTYSEQRGRAGTPRRFPVREVAQAWLARAR